jgi:Na+/H+-translocating membrane pyrophosphatase
MWLFAQTAGIVAVFYKIAGVIYERSIDCGEVIIKPYHKQQEKNPGKYSYNVGNLVGPILSTTTEYYTIFITIVMLGMVTLHF